MPDPMPSFRKPIDTEFACTIKCLQDKTRILRCVEKYMDSFSSKFFFYCKTHECYNLSIGFVLGLEFMFIVWMMTSMGKHILKKMKGDKMKMKDSESGSCAKINLK